MLHVEERFFFQKIYGKGERSSNIAPSYTFLALGGMIHNIFYV